MSKLKEKLMLSEKGYSDLKKAITTFFEGVFCEIIQN